MSRSIAKGKTPAGYKRKQREAKRDRDLALFASLGDGFVSRHIEDPEGSKHWVETGKWGDEL